MKMLRVSLVLLSVVVLSLGCRKTDVRTVVIRVPGMINRQCADIIVNALRQARYGVRMDSIETDLEMRRIVLKYDSMKLSLKNVEFTIAKAGFQANVVPADEKARAALPDACRE